MMIQNRIVGLVGPKGRGKSWELKKLLKDRERVLVISTVRDPLFKDYRTFEGNMRELFEHIGLNKKFHALFMPRFTQAKTMCIDAPGIELVLDTVFEKMSNLTVAFDEAHMLCTPYNMPNAILKLFRMGRHKQIDLFYVSHSFAGVHNVLTQNTDTFVFWQVISPADVEGIRKRCGPEAAERVLKLGVLRESGSGVIAGEMLHWTKEKGIEP